MGVYWWSTTHHWAAILISHSHLQSFRWSTAKIIWSKPLIYFGSQALKQQQSRCSIYCTLPAHSRGCPFAIGLRSHSSSQTLCISWQRFMLLYVPNPVDAECQPIYDSHTFTWDSKTTVRETASVRKKHCRIPFISAPMVFEPTATVALPFVVPLQFQRLGPGLWAACSMPPYVPRLLGIITGLGFQYVQTAHSSSKLVIEQTDMWKALWL